METFNVEITPTEEDGQQSFYVTRALILNLSDLLLFLTYCCQEDHDTVGS